MGSGCCCFHVKEPVVEDNDIDGANNNEADGFFPKFYTKIKEYAASISSGTAGSVNSSTDRVAAASSSSSSGSPQSGSTTPILQPPTNPQGLNLQREVTSLVPDHGEGGINQSHSDSLMKSASGKNATEILYLYASLERKDECPTCLEEYTPENPMTTMQCSHHFHLGCIFEWIERSQTCPICSRVMLFNETP